MMKVCHKITEEGLSEGVCRACVHRLSACRVWR